jgi:hypothetical protein
VSGKVSSTGGDNISGLKRDNSTVGVGNKSSISKTVDTNRVDSSTSSGMGNLGSIDSGLINGDNGTISVGNKSMRVSSSIWVGSIRISSIANRDHVSKLPKMNSSGKGNLGGVCGHNSSVRVGHQTS